MTEWQFQAYGSSLYVVRMYERYQLAAARALVDSLLNKSQGG
ncbi:Uncharacterised protein [Xylophilus ampelinus]|nr:Uncharacterised protein [Xylophilus ampelinus]